ncbi:MAG: 4Fe-4S binding protein [Candidatus Cloacimonetes bacterium]|nr:4Fe-4S binding protein [Candidatus Cloacimonadota bacterium]
MDRRHFFKYIKNQFKDGVAVYLAESSTLKDPKALIDPIVCHEKVDPDCRLCMDQCLDKKALFSTGLGMPMLKIDNCDGCNKCVTVCPVKAISIVEKEDHPFGQRRRF